MTANDPPEWVLLYDGPCALCQGAVQWIMARDRAQLFCYSPPSRPLGRIVEGVLCSVE